MEHFRYSRLSFAVIILLLSSVISTTYASSVRIGVQFVKADGLWIADEDTDFENDDGDFGSRTITQYELSSAYNLSDDENLFFSLAYSEAIMNDIGFADVSADDGRRGISNLGVAYLNKFYKGMIDVSVGVGVRTPGDNRSGNTFIAISDGFTKYDAYLNFNKNFGKLRIFLDNRYTVRPEAINQMLNSFGITSPVISKLFIGARFDTFDTFGGSDIGGSGFSVNNVPGFARVKESYQSVAINAAYLFNSLVYDIYVSQKISGENTDMSEAVGFGVTNYF